MFRWTIFFAKMDNHLWVYNQLKLAEDSSKVTAIITPWVSIGFSHFRLVYQLREGISSKNGHEIFI